MPPPNPQHSLRLKNREPWAIRRQRRNHDEAVMAYGEYCIIVMLWILPDHEKNLVERCSRCWGENAEVADVYGQGRQKDCPVCYGTNYEGGYKAILYRPSMWDYNEPTEEEARRGEITRQTASVQLPSDFTPKNGDYLIRRDGTRWQVQSTSTNHLRTGFGTSDARTDALGWNLASVVREDESAVAYLIPPTTEEAIERLSVSDCRYWPMDFSEHEVIRGPVH
jgi:hypothetical protein